MGRSHLLRQAVPLVLVAVLAILAFGWSYTFDSVPPMLVRSFQPSLFPQLVSGTILALAALCVIKLARGETEEEKEPVPAPFYGTVVVLFLAGLATLLSDFLLALMIGATGIAAVWGERRALVLLGIGIVAPVVILLFFDQALQIRFPRGFLLNLYYG